MCEDRASADAIASKVYRDEPIARTAVNLLPQKYLEMKKIARIGALYGHSDAMVFYKQGKFMEDFEDDAEFHGDFVRYFPTYQYMDDRQLRGYFSWRTRVRRGVVGRTSLSFVFVYLYELLNRIGVESAEAGFHALKNFRDAYREIDSKIDRYVGLWLQDYVVYNNLDRNLLAEFPNADFDRAVLTLLNYDAYGRDDVFEALNSLSSYDLKNSRFFKEHPEDVRSVVAGVFAELAVFHSKNRKNSICEKFFGKMHSSSYCMFRSAVFYDRPQQEDRVYEVNDICRYRRRNGSWSCERFWSYKDKVKETGVLLKLIDFLMREQYGFKSALKVEPPTRICREIILGEIGKYLESKRKKALPPVEIDISRLQGIRESALEIQNKLLVEEAEADEEPPEPESKTALSDAEYRLLGCLLYGRAYEPFVRSENLMLSVLIDSINEKLFDEFGDTVIACIGEQPELIEDYIEDLKGMIEE